MAQHDPRALAALEAVVAEVEAHTSAEVVLVLARRAEAYPDAPWKAGALAALVALAALIFLPWSFRAEWLLLDTACAFGLGWLFGRAGWTRRLLTCPRRREAAVARAAREQWTARGAGLTRERTGVLVLVSWLERRTELLWDVGVDQKVPVAAWSEARRALQAPAVFRDSPEGLRRGLDPLGRLLAAHLPVQPGDKNELPNRPVVIG
jgi:putative membrane protein